MSLDGIMHAELVWDGTDEVRIPKMMGTPREDQMHGTARDRLVELAGRVCYDSVGAKSSRNSPDYHKHVHEVNHGALWEHAAVTVQFVFPAGSKSRFGMSNIDASNRLSAMCNNRPGLWVEERMVDGEIHVRLTANVRTINEWQRKNLNGPGSIPRAAIGRLLIHVTKHLAPAAMIHYEPDSDRIARDVDELHLGGRPVDVEPETDEEKWITLYMVGSRGWSHEQVRHKYQTAVSQRSTRYCDESESPWVTHPLLAAYQEATYKEPKGTATNVRTALGSFAQKIESALRGGGSYQDIDGAIKEVRDVVQELRDYADFWEGEAHGRMLAQESRILYFSIVNKLQKWLTDRGVEKFTARKQARGAARGFLGNALQTEVIFSASVAQWRHMLRMRAADAADAEIRRVFAGPLVVDAPGRDSPERVEMARSVLQAVRQSRYAECFKEFELAPSSDGVGMSLKGGGAK